MHAQLPVQRWSPVFALTEGREPVNPRPLATAAAFRDQIPQTRGFIAYSEGVNDDWNVAQWLALSWNPSETPSDTALRYARLFIGDDRFAAIPEALERNWHGDPADNAAIPATLRQIDALHPAPWADWRIDLYRYRAVYDALDAQRWKRARTAQAKAGRALRSASMLGAETAAQQALTAMSPVATPAEAQLYTRLETLAARLWQHARMQLSVTRYGASNWERGANLDRAMIDLTDKAALAPRIKAALALPAENKRAAALVRLGDRPDARDRALYDDLGNAGHEPHLVTGPGEGTDPQGRQGAIDGVADHLPQDGWALSELSYAEALYEQPLHLRYTQLPKGQSWCLRYTWAGEDYWRPLQISAGGEVIVPFHNRKNNPAFEQTAIPAETVHDGTLDVTFVSPPGAGGSGRGRQIAETWLVPAAPAQCSGEWTGP
ncbi:hypothetical protein [Novosphingobium sp. 9]|uniref:hypothetical protein n=1 Tax=Novosphingobium sp. 9 TaxID=2025349 RepID=UPI0021B635CD|nr:hypothetical protein [Novosphingobium sp. 9]